MPGKLLEQGVHGRRKVLGNGAPDAAAALRDPEREAEKECDREQVEPAEARGDLIERPSRQLTCLRRKYGAHGDEGDANSADSEDTVGWTAMCRRARTRSTLVAGDSPIEVSIPSRLDPVAQPLLHAPEIRSRRMS